MKNCPESGASSTPREGLIPVSRELVVRADSLLSLLWHRHVPSDRKDSYLSRDVESTIGELRKAAARISAQAAGRPKVITDLLAVDDTGVVAGYIRKLEADQSIEASEAAREGYRVQVEERYGAVAQWQAEAEMNRQAWLKSEARAERAEHRVKAVPTADGGLEALIEEMRVIARVAGQCSVEGPQDGAALMAAAEADRATRWADRLEALLKAERQS